MKHWNSDLKKDTLSNYAEKCSESIAKATESLAELASVLEKVKKQNEDEIMKALDAQIRLKEYIERINQPEYDGVVWQKDEVVLLLKELIA